MNEDDVEFLTSVYLFEPLSRGEIEGFAGEIPVIDFERGQNVYTPAYRGEMFFLLLRGRVRTYRTEGGREITLAVVEPGEMFGESAFAARRREGAYAEALEPSRVALMNRAHLERLLRINPQAGLKAIELLSKRLSLYENKIVDLGLKGIPSRLAGLILELAHREGVVTREGHKIPTRYTHEQLGTMIGAKRVAVTRALTELRRSGAVEVRHRQIYVRDMQALERAAT